MAKRPRAKTIQVLEELKARSKDLAGLPGRPFAFQKRLGNHAWR